MKHKHLVAATAIAASVVGGAAGGALLFTPQLSGAQESTTSTTVATSTPPADARPHAGIRGGSLATAAKALGMTEADLRSALESGKTIAQVAKDKGVDVQKVIDALVADARQKLQQEEADLPARISDLVNGKLPAGGPGVGVGRGGHGVFGTGLHQVATALGLSDADLRSALQSGKSIADIAKDKGVDLQHVVDTLVQAADTRIDQAVTDGRLTTDQATKLKATLKDGITAFVNDQRPAGGPGFGGRGFGGRGFRGGPEGGTSGSAPAQGQGSSYTS
jgi:flagellar hook-length control protein FliK